MSTRERKLEEKYQAMTVIQLKEELKKRGCPRTGNKAELIRKLLLAECSTIRTLYGLCRAKGVQNYKDKPKAWLLRECLRGQTTPEAKRPEVKKTLSTLRKYARELGCTGTQKMDRPQLLRILAEQKCPERKQQIRRVLLKSTTLPTDIINIITGMTGDCRADVLEKRFRQLQLDGVLADTIFTFLQTQPGVRVFSATKYLPLQKDEVVVVLEQLYGVGVRDKITVFHTYASLLDYYSTEKDWVYELCDMPVPVANDRRALRTRANELKRCLRKLPHLELDILVVPCHVLETTLDKNELIDLYPADDLYYTDHVSPFEDYQPESPAYQPESPTYSPI